ncbi:MAG: RNA-binding protein [Bdellovibrionales bacterium]|nr:RNA-binding protein [Bdellovibrionales bacterium]
MSKKLFVGNLPFEVNDADLASVLGVAGTVVSAKVVINKKTGRSKGYGFVEMETEEMAQAAVTKFEGATLNERAITVQIASPKMEKDAAAESAAETADAGATETAAAETPASDTSTA